MADSAKPLINNDDCMGPCRLALSAAFAAGQPGYAGGRDCPSPGKVGEGQAYRPASTERFRRSKQRLAERRVHRVRRRRSSRLRLLDPLLGTHGSAHEPDANRTGDRSRSERSRRPDALRDLRVEPIALARHGGV